MKKDLADYSGEFIPGVRYENFSKDALSRLCVQYAWMNICLDGWWQDVITEKMGKEKAIEFEKAVWQQKGIPHWQTRVMNALDIIGSDVAACIRTLQMDPAFCYEIFDLDWDLKNRNRGTLTIKGCPAVKRFETSDAYKLKHMCQLDLELLNKIAKFFNPDMEVKALQPLPRKSKDGICCKFEFKLESKDQKSGLDDSSIEFNPKMRYQDLPKEKLVRLTAEYARLGLRLDGWWQEAVKEKLGENVAVECEKMVWERGVPYWQTRTMKALNIKGNDVSTCVKTLQMDPQLSFNVFDIEWWMRDKNHAGYTIKSCHAVRYFESINDIGRLAHMCRLDWDAYRKIAKFFNPDIETVALFMPPRNSKEEICCKFEFRLEPKAPKARQNRKVG